MNKKKDKVQAVQDYIFKSNKLSSEGMVITTVKTQSYGYVTAIENIPVDTFRGGAYYKDVLKRHETEEQALEEHEKIIESTINAAKGKTGEDKQ